MKDSLRLLGLAYRAGKLAVGDTAVSEAVFAKRARLICTASDASGRLVERAQNMPDQCKGLYVSLPFTQAELGTALGRASCSIAAFLDPGLSWAFANKLVQIDYERYKALSDALEGRKDRAERRKVKKKTARGKRAPRNQARGGRSND